MVNLTIVNRGLTLGIRDGKFPITICGHATTMARGFVTAHTRNGGIGTTCDLRRFIRSLRHPHHVLIVIGTNKPISTIVSRLHPLLSSNSVVVSNNGSLCRSARHHAGSLRSANLQFVNVNIDKNRRNTLLNPDLVPNNAHTTCSSVRPVIGGVTTRISSNPYIACVKPQNTKRCIGVIRGNVRCNSVRLVTRTCSLVGDILNLSRGRLCRIFTR